MRYVIKGNFNPLNSRQLEYMAKVREKYGTEELYLWNRDKGVLFDVSIAEYDYLHRIRKSEVSKKKDKVIKIPEDYDVDYRDGDFRYFSDRVIETIFNDLELLRQIPEKLLSPRRFAHSISVAETAVDISRYGSISERDAYVAGLLHDICKELDRDRESEWISKYFPECVKLDRKIFHQYTGYIFIKRYMRYENSSILNAVLHHVDGSSSEPLAMAVYIADKIEPLRGYDTSRETSMYKKDLQACFKVVRATQVKYLEKELNNDEKRDNNQGNG